jgi:hypothetical protein
VLLRTAQGERAHCKQHAGAVLIRDGLSDAGPVQRLRVGGISSSRTSHQRSALGIADIGHLNVLSKT